MDLRVNVFEGVYPPSEDSFLLERHMGKRKGPFLEIGTGTGFVALSNAILNRGSRIMGVDISGRAVENARYNARLNGISNAEFFVSDVFSGVEGKFDTVCFNPPYLGRDGSSTGQDSNLIDMGQIDIFLSDFRDFLSERGNAYLILSSNNGRLGHYLGKIGEYDILERERYFFEELMLVGFR